MAESLNSRSGRVLATVVREYIHTGEPVASLAIARRSAVGVSPATIRNILARLEAEGFVRQPHTSAGRVPTDRGYRFYVDLLLDGRRAAGRATGLEAQIRQLSLEEVDVGHLLAGVSHLLSQESRHVGFAIAPPVEDARLRRMEFVSVAPTRVLVVAVAENGQVTQKVVETGEELTPAELQRAAAIVNEQYGGRPLDEVRASLVARMQEERSLYDRLAAQAMSLAHRTLADRARDAVLYVEGAASLLDEASQLHSSVSLGTLRAVVEMIEEKQRLVRLLTEYLDGPGLTVVIGAEHASPDLQSFSLVAATFTDGGGTGSVGVLGPTRMRYSRAIAVVDGAARTVGDVLRGSN